MRPLVKGALVLGGYVAALLVAAAVVAVQVAMTSGPVQQASSGMLAFSDSLLFLAVFGVAAVPSTVAALLFLRPVPWFWRALSIAALCIAATGLAAVAVHVGSRTAGAGSLADAWWPLAMLRILAAPFFAFAFLLAGLLAPSRSLRIALLVATAVEGVVFASVASIWLLGLRP